MAVKTKYMRCKTNLSGSPELNYQIELSCLNRNHDISSTKILQQIKSVKKKKYKALHSVTKFLLKGKIELLSINSMEFN